MLFKHSSNPWLLQFSQRRKIMKRENLRYNSWWQKFWNNGLSFIQINSCCFFFHITSTWKYCKEFFKQCIQVKIKVDKFLSFYLLSDFAIILERATDALALKRNGFHYQHLQNKTIRSPWILLIHRRTPSWAIWENDIPLQSSVAWNIKYFYYKPSTVSCLKKCNKVIFIFK